MKSLKDFFQVVRVEICSTECKLCNAIVAYGWPLAVVERHQMRSQRKDLGLSFIQPPEQSQVKNELIMYKKVLAKRLTLS